MANSVVIIGAGFAGLSAAAFMAKAGWQVDVVEKHGQPGGRARQLRDSGFTFDMGPSWYWMPDVFERFFASFGKSVKDYYALKRLDPSYRIYWEDGYNDIPARLPALKQLFEKIEPGAGRQLDLFLKEAAYKYRVGMQNLVFKPGSHIGEFIDWDFLRGILQLDVFTSMRKHVNKHFKTARLRHLMEFPVLFLGALAKDTPALYSLMNYADMVGGTWYPEHGMYSIVRAMHRLCEELGVRFHFHANASEIRVARRMASGVLVERGAPGENLHQHFFEADAVIGSADYHFIENALLEPRYRSYSKRYWESRTMAPSCLLYYVGLNKKLDRLRHHSLFFDVPFDQHGNEIYKTPRWPAEPLFYVSATSVTDPQAAPEGCENLFFLVPVAAGLEGDTKALREKYFHIIVSRMEKHLGQSIRDAIIYYKSFAHADFVHDYNSFKGNAYGLANTLRQTALLKPGMRSRRVRNLFYAGQLTVPGPGVPPSLISGEVAAGEVIKHCT